MSSDYKTPMQRNVQLVKRAVPLALADALILVVSYLAAYSVRLETYHVSLSDRARLFLLGAVILMLTLLYFFGGYRRIWSRTSGHDVQVIVSAVVLSTIILSIADLFFSPRPFPMSVVLMGNLLAMTGFVAVRYRSRLISGLSWRWRAVWHLQFPNLTRVLIVGAGDAGQTTAWRLKHRARGENKFFVVGFVDDDPQKQGLYIENSRVLGTRTDIPALVEKYRVELIIVAIHNIDGPSFREVLSYCEHTHARIKIIPDVFALLNGKNGVQPLRDVRAEDLLGRQTVDRHAAVDMSPITNKVILVTGAAGSIGSELCRQLLSYQPVRLIMLDNNESGLHDLETELKTAQNAAILQPFLADITNRRALVGLFETYHPQVIFHSAAYKHVPILERHPNEAVRVNIGGTQQVAGLARDYGAERFVLISTDKAVHPTSIMGASKRVCELLMHAYSQQGGHNTLFTSVRFGNVLGSRGSVVPTFNRQIEAGGPVTVTDPEMTRYFMTIPEAVNLVLHAACLTKGDDLFMLRMGEVVRILDLAERMIRLRGLIPHEDISIEFTGIRPGEKLHEELHTEAETTLPTPHPYIVELITHQNGWKPVLFSDRLNSLFQMGLDGQQQALPQLLEIIALGEAHLLTIAPS
jgi:FlaA1/EpsC-like NDP-sugar epimerase